jgi:hypothetical protein
VHRTVAISCSSSSCPCSIAVSRSPCLPIHTMAAPQPLTKQDVSDLILDHIVEQLLPQPDGSYSVSMYSCIGNAGTHVHAKTN